MIKVNYTELDGPAGPTCRLEASGHAGYAPAGQDIVCAAVSVLAQTLANKVDAAARSGRLLASCVSMARLLWCRPCRNPARTI